MGAAGGTFPLHTGLFQEMLPHALIRSRIRAYTEGMTTNTTTGKYILKATDDHEITCAQCGRTELARVVWLAELDADGNEGTAAAYGTTCAARLMAPKAPAGVAKSLTNLAKAAAFVKKYIDSEYTLELIRDTVAVRYNVRATVEDGTVSFLSNTGWFEVATRAAVN